MHRLFSGATFAQPIQITPCARHKRQNQKFRRVVRVFREDELFQSWQAGRRRFQNHQHFAARFNFAAPAIVRFDFGNEIRARNQPRLQSRLGQRACRFQIRRGHENDSEFSG